MIRIYFDEPIFSRNGDADTLVLFDPTNSSRSAYSAELFCEHALRVQCEDSGKGVDLSPCPRNRIPAQFLRVDGSGSEEGFVAESDGVQVDLDECFVVLPITRSPKTTTATPRHGDGVSPSSSSEKIYDWFDWFGRGIQPQGFGHNELIVAIVRSVQVLRGSEGHVDQSPLSCNVSSACDEGETISRCGVTNFAETPVVFDPVSCERARPSVVYHDYVDTIERSADENDPTTSLAAIEERSGENENLLTRAALAMGFGPDTFIDPIAGGAVTNIISDLLQKYLGYFTSCITARFSGFLLGWENDVGRPQVIIWDVMDMMKEMDKTMFKIESKMTEVKQKADVATGLALADVELAKAQALNAKLQAEAALKLATAMAGTALAQGLAMANAALAQAKAMAAQLAAMAAMLAAQAKALAEAALAAAMAAAQAAAAAAAQLQAMLAAMAAAAMAAAAGMMDMAKTDISGMLGDAANLAKKKADAAADSAKAAAASSTAHAEALAASARANAAASAEKAKAAAVAMASEMLHNHTNATNATNATTTTQSPMELEELLVTTEAPIASTSTVPAALRADSNATNVTSTTSAPSSPKTTTTTEKPCDSAHEQCDYPKSAFESYSHELEDVDMGSVEPATVRVGVLDDGDSLESVRDDLTTLLEKWAGGQSLEDTSKEHVHPRDRDRMDAVRAFGSASRFATNEDDAEEAMIRPRDRADVKALQATADAFRFDSRNRATAAAEMSVEALVSAQTRARTMTLEALDFAMDAVRSARRISVIVSETDSTTGEDLSKWEDLTKVEMTPKAIKKWGAGLLRHIDENRGPGPRSAGYVMLEESRVLQDGAPTEEDGGLTKIFVKTLVKQLTPQLSRSLTSTISAALHERLTQRVISDLAETLPSDIASHLESTLTAGVGESVGFVVSSILERQLPFYLSDSLRDTLTSTMTRALTHTLTPTLIHTLRSNPSTVLASHRCQRCLQVSGGNVDTPSPACAVVCSDEVLADIRAERHALYYGHILGAYYSDWYAAFYNGQPEPHPEKDESAPAAS